MSASPNSQTEHELSQEEDNKLFLATGFRYLPCRERGFPYPWCAKKSGKGWIVRDAPPISNKGLDTAAQFKGWRAADKMLRSRNILLQRVQNKERHERDQRSTKQGKSEGSKEKCKPLKKRNIKPLNNGIDKSLKTITAGEYAVDHWFRHTSIAIQSQARQTEEEDFQSFLKKRQVEVRQEWRKKKKDEKKKEHQTRIDNLRAKRKLEEISSASTNPTPNASSLPPSPTRRKHKKMTPVRNQQNPESIVLGDDPQLDEMIEGIVDEFTHEFAKEHDSDIPTKGMALGNRVEFDGGAVSALREAARETLTMIAQQGTTATQGSNDTAASGGEVESARMCSTREGTKEKNTQHSENDKDVTDRRIADMIEQLIGEVTQDSGCQFDGRAVAALREAAKEIMEGEG